MKHWITTIAWILFSVQISFSQLTVGVGDGYFPLANNPDKEVLESVHESEGIRYTWGGMVKAPNRQWLVEFLDKNKAIVTTEKVDEPAYYISFEQLVTLPQVRYLRVCSIEEFNRRSKKNQLHLLELPATLSASIPECSVPVKVSLKEKNGNIIIECEGPAASVDGIQYEVSILDKDNSKAPELRLFEKGRVFTIEKLPLGKTYEVKIRKVCVELDPKKPNSKWVNLGVINMPASRIQLSPFTCGDAVSNHIFVGSIPASANPVGQGDTIYYNNLPVLIDSIEYVPNGEGYAIGIGYTPIPFGGKVVKVEFAFTAIDNSHHVLNLNTVQNYAIGQYVNGCGGGGGQRSAAISPCIPGASGAIFGGAICVPPPVTGLNAFGFDQDGLYALHPPYLGWQPGMPIDSLYDPNGFDVNGIHVSTNSIYNENGCSQAGLDSLNAPCNANHPSGPYYWLGNTATPEALALVESVKDSLPVWVRAILLDIKTSTVPVNCDSLKLFIQSKMTGLTPQEQQLISGNNNQYLNAGLSKFFTSTPDTLGVHMDRNADIEDIERAHVALYHCDKNGIQVNIQDSLIQFLLTDTTAFNQLVQAVKAGLLKLDAPSAIAFSLPANRPLLMDYIQQLVQGQLDEKPSAIFGYLEWNPSSIHQERKNFFLQQKQNFYFNNQDALWADSDKLSGSINEGFSDQDLLFGLQQGWTKINGEERAIVLERIVNERSISNKLQEAMSMFSSGDSTLLPMSLRNMADDGRLYDVYIDNVQLFPTTAFMDLYLVLNIPQDGQKIVFGLTGVEYGSTGPLAMIANGQPLRLELANEVRVRLGKSAELWLDGNGRTYVQVDCQGFAGVGVGGRVEICRDYVVPLDQNLEPLPDSERVKFEFQTTMTSWGNFYLQFNVPTPFAIAKIEQYAWTFSNAVLDFSDVLSPTLGPNPLPGSTLLPLGYENPWAVNGAFAGPWRGFYLQDLTVTFPEKFGNNSGTPTTVGVEKLVIDDFGVSGAAFVTNLVNLREGSAGGWAFSVDTFKLHVLYNQVVGSNLSGKINVPIFKSEQNCQSTDTNPEDCFDYRAFMDNEGRFAFNLRPAAGNLCIPLWKGSGVIVDSTSTISLIDDGTVFKASATIHAKLELDGDLNQRVNLRVPEVTVQNLVLSNEAPYLINIGVWRFPQEVGANIGGFGFSIDNIVLGGNADKVGLRFNAGVEIGAEDADLKIAARGAFEIEGTLGEDSRGRQRWVYDGFKMDGFLIDADLKALHVKGGIQFFDDNPTYGKGFKGALEMTLKALPTEQTFAVAGQFGKLNDTRYFFVDALYCGKITLFTGLDLRGIGGGVYYNMRETTPANPFSLGCTGDPVISFVPGVTLSGATYGVQPGDLSFKMNLTLAAPKENAMTLATELVVAFNKPTDPGSNGRYSLKYIKMNGVMKGMAPFNIGLSSNANISSDMGLVGIAALEFKFGQEKEFSGNFQASFKAGPNPSNLVVNGGGVMAILIKQNEWFFKIGEPFNQRPGEIDRRFGVVVKLTEGISVQAKCYLFLGKNVPPLPPMPAEIYSLTGASNLYNPNEMSADGFMFGVYLGANMQFNPSILFANLDLMLGTDIAIKDFGPNAICANTNKPLGVNGWYAMGQFYSRIHGDFGIKIRGKNYSIGSLTIGCALQGRLPNPVFAEGAIGVSYSILGGIYQGSSNFQVTIGEPCQIEGVESPFANLTLIKSTFPANDQTNVNCLTDLKVDFHLPMHIPQTVTDPFNNSLSFEGKIEKMELRKDGFVWPIKYDKWSSDHKALTKLPAYALNGNDTFQLYIKAVLDSSGVEIANEERTVSFVTGAPQKVITKELVATAYPFDGMFNFYRKEDNNHQGYVYLDRWLPYLDEIPEDKLQAKIKVKDGLQLYLPVTLNRSERTITFPLPSGGTLLVPGKMVKLTIVRRPESNPQTGSTNNAISAQSLEIPNLNTIQNPNPTNNSFGAMTNVSAGDPPSLPGDEELFTTYFRTSLYSTFKEKIDALFATGTASGVTITSNLSEPFVVEQEVRTNGNPYGISAQVMQSTETWYQNYVYYRSHAVGAIAGSPYFNSNTIMNIDDSDILKIEISAVSAHRVNAGTFIIPNTPTVTGQGQKVLVVGLTDLVNGTSFFNANNLYKSAFKSYYETHLSPSSNLNQEFVNYNSSGFAALICNSSYESSLNQVFTAKIRGLYCQYNSNNAGVTVPLGSLFQCNFSYSIPATGPFNSTGLNAPSIGNYIRTNLSSTVQKQFIYSSGSN